MANLPYVTANSDKVLGIMKMYSRMGAYPLDATSVFGSKADVEAYIAERGSYAYAGQVVAVANGSVTSNEHTGDYSLYMIRSDKTLQEVGKNRVFDGVSTANTFIAANPNAVAVGELITVANTVSGTYTLYMVKGDRTLQRVSFDSTDIPDVTWANLQNKPSSTTTQIDNAVTNSHTHNNKTAIDKITELTSGKPAYDNNELAYKSDLTFSNLTTTPTTISGYGITDAYTKTEADGKYTLQSDVVTTAAANKILKLDANAKIPASVLSGTISIENLPHGALERCVVVANDTERFALTITDVQKGDTVKVTASNKMYFVVDDTKLDEDAGYEVYMAGSASSVPWTGVEDTPTTLSGYGITDAVNSGDVVTAAAANKILKLNGDSKLPASITGDADTVDGKHASDFVAATDVVTTATANKVLKLDSNSKLPASITGDADTVDGKHATDFVAATDVVTTATANKVLKLNNSGKLPADITGNAATASSVAWSGITNTPTTLAGYGITDAYTKTEADGNYVAQSDVSTTAKANAILKLNTQGKLPADITGNAATASSVAWSGITDTPITLSGYGITDAVSSSDVVTTATANKILKLNNDGKLPASITGEAGSVAWSNVSSKPTTISGYGITDAYTKTEADGKYTLQADVVTTATANKILKLDANAKIPASILSGVIPIENIPSGALERCVVVANDTARFALTTENIQKGDTVKVTATNKMYFVVDDTKLNIEAGYEVYAAGAASSVPWSGVTDTPTTLSGYGITDAYTKTEADGKYTLQTDIVTTATANKVLKLNSDSKLPASITGEAGSVAWANITNKPTSTVAQIDTAVTAATHTNRTQLDKISENANGKITYNSNLVAYMSDLTSAFSVSASEPSGLPTGGLWFDTSTT